MEAKPAAVLDPTASKLLQPKKRRRIEIWRNEVAQFSPGPPASSSRQDADSFPPLSEEEPQSTNSSRPRSIFHTLRSAVTSNSKSGRIDDDKNSKYDPALSTRMFLDSSVEISTDQRRNGGHSEDKGTSSSASSFNRLGSSVDGDGTDGRRLLDEKLARLKRAQKLLDKGKKATKKDV